MLLFVFIFSQLPSHEYVGELLLSLNYFPTTQRLTIVVLKARNLKIDTKSGLWGEFAVIRDLVDNKYVVLYCIRLEGNNRLILACGYFLSRSFWICQPIP